MASRPHRTGSLRVASFLSSQNTSTDEASESPGQISQCSARPLPGKAKSFPFDAFQGARPLDYANVGTRSRCQPVSSNL